MKRATLTSLGCMGALVFAAAATLDPVVIKRTPIKDQKISYSMNGSISVAGQNGEIASKITDTITDVGADGTYTTKSEQADITFNGMPAPTDPAATVSVSRANGSLVSISGGDDANAQGRMASLTQFYYPTKPVSVGDAWSYDGKKDDKLGSLDFHADMKYLGDEKVGTFDTWKIQEDVKESGATPAVIHSTTWLDKADGSMVKVESTFTDLPVAAGFSVSGKMNIVRK